MLENTPRRLAALAPLIVESSLEREGIEETSDTALLERGASLYHVPPVGDPHYSFIGPQLRILAQPSSYQILHAQAL